MPVNFLPSSVMESSIHPPGRGCRPLTSKNWGSRSVRLPHFSQAGKTVAPVPPCLVERVLIERTQWMVRRVVDDLSIERPVPIIIGDESDLAVGVEVHAPDVAADFLTVDWVRCER